MADLNYGPLLIVSGITIITISAILLRTWFSTQYIQEVYDKCDVNEVKYRYFIRFVFNPKSRKGFDLNKNTITVRIHDKRGLYVSTFNIRTTTVARDRYLRRQTIHELQLILNRKDRIPEWGQIAIHVEDSGSIFVYLMRICGIDTKERFVVQINSDIKSREPTKQFGVKLFKCEPQVWKEGNEEGRPEKKIEISELIMILYWSLNMNMLALSVLYHFSDESSYLRQNLWALCLISAVLGFFAEIIVLLFYRLYLKYKLWRTYGNDLWGTLSYLVLFICFISGFIACIGTIYLLHRPDASRANLYLIFSVLLHFGLNVVFVVISYVLKCQFFASISSKEVRIDQNPMSVSSLMSTVDSSELNHKKLKPSEPVKLK